MAIRVRLATLFLAVGCAVPSFASADPALPSQIFPPSHPINTDISSYPVQWNSAAIVSAMGAATSLHPDFGTVIDGAAGTPVPWGIPFRVVLGNQAKVAIHIGAYVDESDPGPMPIPPDSIVEGGNDAANDGDRHLTVIDRDNQILYEIGNAYKRADDSWDASGAAIFDLKTVAYRPLRWTSTDAAGLPVFPCLVRYEEVAAGEITHAIRFTAQITQRAFILPGRHFASSNTGTNRPAMGMRFRLKASYDISTFPAQAQVILRAMKKYGLIMSDNGSNWFFTGAPDPRWDDAQINTLKRLHGSDFDVVETELLNPLVTTTLTTATLTWQTADAAGTQVDFGATTGYGSSTPLITTLTTSHSATITGLAPNTLYFYRMRSKNGDDSNDGGNYTGYLLGSFTTSGDSVAPSAPVNLHVN